MNGGAGGIGRGGSRRISGVSTGWRRVAIHAAALAVSFCAAGLKAADDSKIIFPSGSAPGTAPVSSSGGTANMLTLVVALILAAVGAWFFIRNRRATAGGRDGRSLAIEESRSLGNRQYLVVASYEGRKFLLGVCPGRIDMLAPLNERRAGEENLR